MNKYTVTWCKQVNNSEIIEQFIELFSRLVLDKVALSKGILISLLILIFLILHQLHIDL